MKRWIAVLPAVVLGLAICAHVPHVGAAGPWPKAVSGTVKVDFNTEGLGPRDIEDTTETAIPRDYATAWNALETALSQNRTDILDTGWIGGHELFPQCALSGAKIEPVNPRRQFPGLIEVKRLPV